MTKLSIRQMIDSGAWYRCEGEGIGLGSPIQFRIRFTAFRPVETGEIDNPQNISKINLNEGRLWLLSFSAVNQGKVGFNPYYIQWSFVIVDHEDCEFKQADDTYLSCMSTFSLKTGMRRFSGTAPLLAPKMPADGAAVYLLPDEECPGYSLKMVKKTRMEEI